MATNCYLFLEEKSRELLIIDPGEDANFIAEKIVQSGTKPKAIMATHGHFDHLLGAKELQLTFDIPFYIHKKDKFLVTRMQETAAHFLGRETVETSPSINAFVHEQDRICGLTVLPTPGHTPGSICLAGDEVIFTGDTIFAGGAVGRTDFSYSDRDALEHSFRKILSFPPKTVIYPGHGEATTVQKEKKYHTIHPWH